MNFYSKSLVGLAKQGLSNAMGPAGNYWWKQLKPKTTQAPERMSAYAPMSKMDYMTPIQVRPQEDDFTLTAGQDFQRQPNGQVGIMPWTQQRPGVNPQISRLQALYNAIFGGF